MKKIWEALTWGILYILFFVGYGAERLYKKITKKD